MHSDFLGSDGQLARDPHGCIKTIYFKIGKIDNEGRFLYKIRRSGPWCAAAAATAAAVQCVWRVYDVVYFIALASCKSSLVPCVQLVL